MGTRGFPALAPDEGGSSSDGGTGGSNDGSEFVVGEHVGRMARSGRSTVNSSFAPKDLFDAVVGWSEEELDLIRNMGAAGMLMIDRFTHFNRDFSQFVLQCIDTEKSVLVLGKNRFAELNEHVFCMIVGLREGGDVDIQRTTGPPRAHEICDARDALGLPGHTELTTFDLLAILKKNGYREMTPDLAIRLRTAYAMLAVSVFFSPRDRRGHVPRDAYLLASDPANLCSFNWGKYGLEELLDGAWRVQDAIQRGVRGVTVYGCLLAAQCLYFDNVDTGTMSVPPGLFPRIAQYNASVLKALIQRDTLLLATEKVYGMYRGIVSRAALLRTAPNPYRRRPSGQTLPHSICAPIVQVPSVPQVQKFRRGAVHLQAMPTVESLLPSEADMAPAMNMDDQPTYEAIVRQARDWLRLGFSEIDRNSRNREDEFWRGVTVYDETKMVAAEAFDRKEAVIRLPAIQYLLNQLAAQGVGSRVPSLLVHLNNVTKALRGVPGCSSRPVTVPDFIVTSVSENAENVENVGGGSKSAAWNLQSSGRCLRTCQLVINPAPIRCVPEGGLGGPSNQLFSYDFAAVDKSSGIQRIAGDASGIQHGCPSPVMTDAPNIVSSQRSMENSDSALKLLASTAAAEPFGGPYRFPDLVFVTTPDGQRVPARVPARHALENGPNQIGDNDVDRAMLADGGSGQILGDRGSEDSLDSAGGVVRKRSLANILKDSEGLEYIVYSASKSRRVRTVKNYVLMTKKKVINHVPGLCPFSRDLSLDLPPILEANAAYMNMVFCKQDFLSRMWVIHLRPELLKMNGFDVLTSFHKNGCLTDKGLEIIRRLLKSVEGSWHSPGDMSRFGHCMPKKWLDIVMDGGDFTVNEEMRSMFFGSDVDYDIETCHIIWIPKRNDDGTYVLFGVDLVLEMIHVMDPKMTASGRGILRAVHESTCAAILDAFAACSAAFFDGLTVDKEDWGFAYHEHLHEATSDEDTGWYIVYYMMKFDGLALIDEPDSEELVDLRIKFLLMVMNMEDNLGHPPLEIKEPLP